MTPTDEVASNAAQPIGHCQWGAASREGGNGGGGRPAHRQSIRSARFRYARVKALARCVLRRRQILHPHQFGYSSYDARARSINWPRRGLCRGRHASSSRRLTPADLTGRRPLPSYVHPVLARSMTALDSASMRRRILHPHKKEPRGPSVEVSCKDTHVRARGERAVCRKGDRS
jgi:hypothetical protein